MIEYFKTKWHLATNAFEHMQIAFWVTKRVHISMCLGLTGAKRADFYARKESVVNNT